MGSRRGRTLPGAAIAPVGTGRLRWRTIVPPSWPPGSVPLDRPRLGRESLDAPTVKPEQSVDIPSGARHHATR